MEININAFFTATGNPMTYSASRMELGDNAGEITWGNAVMDAPTFNLLDSEEKQTAFKSHVAEFGAWDEEEINAWNLDELNALFIQLIAGDMREAGLDADSGSADWAKYEEDSQAGQVSGNLFKDDQGEVYYQLSY